MAYRVRMVLAADETWLSIAFYCVLVLVCQGPQEEVVDA